MLNTEKFKRSDFIFIDSFATYVRVIVTKKDKKEYNIPEDSLGYVEEESDGVFIIALPRKWDEATTWHEAHHLARWMNAHHGIITTAAEHEADAYLQEYIVKLLKTYIYNRKT